MHKIDNIVKSFCNNRPEGLCINPAQNFTLSFSVDADGYYDLELKYFHEHWDQWIHLEVTHPDGETLDYMPPLPFGDFAEVTLYFKKGENLVAFKRDFEFGNEIVFKEITLMGASVNTMPKIYPTADCFFKSKPRRGVIVLENYCRKLQKITCGDKEIPFTTESFLDAFEFSKFYNGIYQQREYIYIDPAVISGLPEGENKLVLTLQGGFDLEYTLNLFAEEKDSQLTVLSFDVGHSSANLLKLPNGKNLLIDCGSFKACNEILLPYLKKNNIKVDYFLLTHYHSDHYGNLQVLLDEHGIELPEKVDIKAPKEQRYKYLSKFRYLDSSCLRFYDKLHEIWDLGGVEITALNSRYDIDGNRTEVFNYPQIKYNEHNYENTTSVAMFIKYKGFGFYHGADTYAHCQQRILEDYKKAGAEEELRCHYFYSNHHFHVDLAPEFMHAVNPVIVYINSNFSLYSRSTCIYEYGRDVLAADYEDKRLRESLKCCESGSLILHINSGDDWWYSTCQNTDL